jgi:hypothetical protein
MKHVLVRFAMAIAILIPIALVCAGVNIYKRRVTKHAA